MLLSPELCTQSPRSPAEPRVLNHGSQATWWDVCGAGGWYPGWWRDGPLDMAGCLAWAHSSGIAAAAAAGAEVAVDHRALCLGLGTWDLGLRDLRTSGLLDFWTSGLLDLRTYGFLFHRALCLGTCELQMLITDV